MTKTNLFISISVLLLGLSGSAQAQTAFSVNGQTISAQQQKDLMDWLEPHVSDVEQRALQARNLLIERAVIAQEIKRLKLEQNPQVREHIENAKHIGNIEVLNAELLKGKKPSDEDLTKIYEGYKATWDPNFIQISQIVVPSEKEAMDVLRRLGEHTKFEDLAQKVSIDQSTKDVGGKIPMANARQFRIPGMAAACLSVSSGTVLQRPFQVAPNAWAVIRVDAMEKREPPSMDKLKPQLEQAWQKSYLDSYYKRLIEDAKVKELSSKK
ncbi:MAG: peptidylprolyl isomerase [Burkholderiales bacterium]|nr:peptidylprolyl isomerase [Burkholderiales bacterium]